MNTNNVHKRVPKKKKTQTTEKPKEEERALELPAEHHDVEVEDERWLFNELKRIQKETKNRKSEFERLRLAVYKLEQSNRLRKAEEEEELAAKVDSRQSKKRSRPSYADEFTSIGLRSSSPTFIPSMHSNPYYPPLAAYGPPSSSSLGPCGYRVGILGLPVVVNSGMGNINTSTISNVGNTRKLYCKLNVFHMFWRLLIMRL